MLLVTKSKMMFLMFMETLDDGYIRSRGRWRMTWMEGIEKDMKELVLQGPIVLGRSE